MARPRKNPDDPKWNAQNIEHNVHIEPNNAHKSKQKPDEWILLFSAAFGGLVSRGGMSMDQAIKTASQYADEAYTAITSPLK